MAIINLENKTVHEKDPKMTSLDRISSRNNKPVSGEEYEKDKDVCFQKFDSWCPEDQIDFIEDLLLRMTHFQHGHINVFLKPMLQRDFISALPGKYIMF